MTYPVPRRQFIKGLFLGTISSTFLNKPWSGLFASEVVRSSLPQNGVIRFNIQDFPPLQEEFGSIRIGVNPITPDPDSFPLGYFWPVIISRGMFGEFYCLDSECKHASCVVNAYRGEEGGLACHCHGSLYAIDGTVLNGPATAPLNPYEFTVDGDIMTIQIPPRDLGGGAFVSLGYEVKISRAPNPNSRVRLDFYGYPTVVYEVRFREKLSDAWSTIPFSRTPNGPAEESELVGEDAPVTLYLDRTTPTGFYAAAMRLVDVT